MPVSRRKKASPLRAKQVFLNVPYDRRYERLFVALTVAVIAAGRTPRLTFDIPEVGIGRLRRIKRVMANCKVSIHDLSYARKLPARFNMPFELGLAVALRVQTGDHDFHVLESVEHRLQITLSDLNGIDAKVHGRNPARAIREVLGMVGRPGRNPPATVVNDLYEKIWRHVVPALRAAHGDGFFKRDIYEDLVGVTRWLVASHGLVP